MNLHIWCLMMLVCGSTAAAPLEFGDCPIKYDSGKISGVVRGVELGRVMRCLADQTGIVVRLDQRLETTPVYFDAAAGLPLEEALRRIMKPFNYVFAYEPQESGYSEKPDSPNQPGTTAVLREIHILSQGQAAIGRAYNRQEIHVPVVIAPAAAQAEDLASSHDSNSPASALVMHPAPKPRPNLQRSPFGGPTARFRKADRGPDPRLEQEKFQAMRQQVRREAQRREFFQKEILNKQGRLRSKSTVRNSNDAMNQYQFNRSHPFNAIKQVKHPGENND